MFWYYLRDNWKTLVIGGIVGICCIAFVLSYVNKEFQFNTESLTPVAETETEENAGTIYDKYLENNEEINRQNAQNIDFNAKPVANNLNKTIYAFNELMVKQHQDLKKENVVMTSNGIELYELLNGGEYKEMVKLLSQYTDEGAVKQALKLYGYGVKNGIICYQDGDNKSAYKINTQYPTDITYASDYSAEVTVPLVKNSQSPVIFDYEKDTDRDYSNMAVAIFSFKKQHGKWLIFDIEFIEEVQ